MIKDKEIEINLKLVYDTLGLKNEELEIFDSYNAKF
jgi:hypothetical protein